MNLRISVPLTLGITSLTSDSLRHRADAVVTSCDQTNAHLLELEVRHLVEATVGVSKQNHEDRLAQHAIDPEARDPCL